MRHQCALTVRVEVKGAVARQALPVFLNFKRFKQRPGAHQSQVLLETYGAAGMETKAETLGARRQPPDNGVGHACYSWAGGPAEEHRAAKGELTASLANISFVLVAAALPPP